MTPRTASAVALAATLALAGCLETTSPHPVVETRVGHAALGLENQVVVVSNGPAFELEPLQTVFFAINAGQRAFRFASPADTLDAVFTLDADINAVLLMNPAAPVLRHYRLARLVSGARIAVVNADETRPEAMTVIVEGQDTVSVTVAPADAEVIDLDMGAYDVRLHFGNEAESVAVASFTVGQGDNGFMVLIPSGDPDSPYLRLLF